MTKSKWSLLIAALFMVFGPNAYARDAKVIKLSENETAIVPISLAGCVLSFPTKPTKVVLGKANSFSMDFVEEDLTISPLSVGAKSRLFVYVYGRRFSLDLVAMPSDDGPPVILIRDAKEPLLLNPTAWQSTEKPKVLKTEKRASR